MNLQTSHGAALCAGLALLGATSGCNGSDASTVSSPAVFHGQIVLRDRLGLPLTATSTEPYSPRATCGECHDVDAIANGYHFQQGRTDAHGVVVAKDDYFQDGRTWLKSPGMYGKW